eukprot:TRINITY_DN24420_c0_g2_i1.p1 TRINITY_DN24420_c0_g2~~TRINITY_DN24420_c0_g2_i1.p1  ORF type:complete len:237 (-),score=28.60 TRINITY_DN24420_c0_g2_i1:245-955(-)
MRNLVWDMARTLWEFLVHSRSNHEELMRECEMQLGQIAKRIAKEYWAQHSKLTDISQRYQAATAEHGDKSEKAVRRAEWCKDMSRLFTVIAGICLALLGLGFFRPRALARFGLSLPELVSSVVTKERSPSDNQDARKLRKGSYAVGNGVYRVDWKNDKVTLLSDYKTTTKNTYSTTAYKMLAKCSVALGVSALGFIFLWVIALKMANSNNTTSESEHVMAQAKSLVKLHAEQNQRM